jgi:putative membrane protein
MKKIAILAACALFASPAMAQSVGEKTGVNAVLGISPSTPDFVKEVAVSDMFEIQSSKLAAERGDAATKEFANQMVTDHTKTSSELKAAVASDPNTPIPDALDSAHQKKLDTLQGLNGADFTKQYRSMQVDAHQDAVSLFQRYAKSGDSEKLKTWAVQTLPALQHHLDMAKALDKQSQQSSTN